MEAEVQKSDGAAQRNEEVVETVELEDEGTAESHHNNTTVYLFPVFFFNI